MPFSRRPLPAPAQRVALAHGLATGVGATALHFGGLGVGQATAADSATVVHQAGTLSDLRVRATTGAATTGTATVYKNGVATALTVSFAGGVTNDVQVDSTNTVTVAAGDQLSLLVTRTGGANTIILNAASVLLTITP